VSNHIDYITPGIKLMSGGYDEKITKRMVGRRSLTGDIGGKRRKGGKGKAGRKKGKCKPKPDDPVDDNSIFRVTGPCSDEITPHCIRSMLILILTFESNY
jgi:tripeptidyl-peptidase-1